MACHRPRADTRGPFGRNPWPGQRFTAEAILSSPSSGALACRRCLSLSEASLSRPARLPSLPCCGATALPPAWGGEAV